MKTQLRMIIGLLAITVFTGLASAMEPEVLYKDENVVMEKVGQMIIDAYKVCWRTEEVPNTELSKLSDKAVVIESKGDSDNAVVLYPFFIFNGSYENPKCHFYNFKGEMLKEVNLNMQTAWNFEPNVILFRGFPDSDYKVLHIYDYMGNELWQTEKDIFVMAKAAPGKRVLSCFGEDDDSFTIYDESGEKKKVNFNLYPDSKLIFSSDGQFAVGFNRTQIVMRNYLGKGMWSTKVNFGGYIGQAYVSNSQNIITYYISDDTNAQKIVLINSKGQIANQQIIPRLGSCAFYESINGDNLGVLFSADDYTYILQYNRKNNYKQEKYLLKMDLAKKSFALSYPGWPLVSNNDGSNVFMIMSNRSNGRQKDIIRISIIK